MSHHFDTKRSKEDPSLGICDTYLFSGSPNNTTMILTVNADTGLSSTDVFHPEAIYGFRLDLDGDGKEELAFKFRFDEPSHAAGDEHRHHQGFCLIMAVGERPGLDGETIARGVTGQVVRAGPISIFAGVVPELWAADAAAFQAALRSVGDGGMLDVGVFGSGTNTFRNRNVTAIVLEVPSSMIGRGEVRLWSTISLFGHAPEVQVSRFGYPLFTHLFLSDPETPDLVDRYHASQPSMDATLFAAPLADLVARLSRGTGSVGTEVPYGRWLARLITPSMLTFTLDSEAVFSVDRRNGRPLTDDAYDVMWTLAANRTIRDGVRPDATRVTGDFPYYGSIYTAEEQAGIAPIKALIGYEVG